MIRMDATFGRMWRTMMRQWLTPMYLAATHEFAFAQAHRHAAHDP